MNTKMLEIIAGSIVLMLAWAAIVIMMYEGIKIAFMSELRARAEMLAHLMYEHWVENTKFRVHTGVRIIDETGGEKHGTDTFRDDG